MTSVEIILMDADFKRICAVRDFASVLWERKYYETGSFELRLPVKYLEAAMRASYVYRKDKPECGMIDRFIKDSDGIVLSGGFLESILKTRVIDDVFKFQGTAGAAAVALVNAYCVRAGSGREIERLVIGGHGGIDDAVNVQLSGKTVYDGLRDILTEREAAFYMRYDLREGVIHFCAARGLDRTDSQHENSWCVFSRDYFNVLDETYEKSADIRNFAYVVSGAPENVSPLAVTVDTRKDGEKRMEIYVEARDIWRGNGVSDKEVRELLTERGRQKLAEYGAQERAECVVDMRNMGNMVFELGDVCTYVNAEIGILSRARITEITEAIENNEVSVSVVLGKEQMGLLSSLKRTVGN